MKPAYNVFPLDVSAGLSDYELIIDAKQFQYLEGNCKIWVKIDSTNATQIPLMPKDGFKFPFKRLYITCEKSDQTIRLMATKADDFQLTRPDMNISQDKSLYYDQVVNKNIFGSASNPGATTSQYSGSMIKNETTDKLIIIEKLFCRSGSSSNLVCGFTTEEFDTLVSTLEGVNYYGDSGSSNPSNATVQYGADASLMSPVASRIRDIYWDTGKQAYNALPKAVVLIPGSQFVVQCSTVSISYQVNWCWREISLTI